MSFASCDIRLDRDGFSLAAEFTVPAKGVLGIFGHSGSGKTTLLRCLAGLEKNVQGKVEVNGEIWQDENTSICSQQRNIGYVFQEGRLFPHLTVADNLEYGTRRNPVKNSSLDQVHLFELLNIQQLLERYPQQLSGGEMQRIAIGRALLKSPQLLLLDEPLASLDENRKQEILPYLERLHDESKIPILYVSHNLDEMLRLCDDILVMQQGRSVYNGNIHTALITSESTLATVENAAAILEGSVSKQEKDFNISTVHTVHGNQFQVPGLMTIGKRVRLVVFACDVSLAISRAAESSILNIIEGRISAVLDERDGRVLLQINCNQDVVLSLISVKSFRLLKLSLDKKIYIQVKAVVTHGN
jgi:molybdate transport system ATP-binding protein